MNKGIKAFRVQCSLIAGPAIIRTTSLGRAKFKVFEQARDIGYKVEFRHLNARRAPIYDEIEQLKVDVCYEEYHAKSCINAA